MSKYFDEFPIIEYEGKQIRDITRRNTLMKSVTTNPLVYLPYTVQDGEKPEDIANWYYGSTDYTWLVLMANNIVDPYHQWPKNVEDFNNYMIKKYEAESGKEGPEVLQWAQDEDRQDNVVYYYKEV